ncbi:urea ABC transporter permease subunit UrtB [Glaciimonas sp. Gout2]|uniref:urea ABC transporter permease subunit UrtB n=2 Tax=Glaciimonas TaxID=1229970 RepID=UPI002AB41763|nr:MULTISPECIES: urea ABC transporter permease subunit UrtB [unclassified Glaciimonas]MDY7548888.1 urea ABC transporter permease subunit UrtB [Glaciimonas sp. CA11.2]MEB0012534.1 urea ABC transporter permease subunit UrtB [Glaciimonas sp. Cout2]MEB0084148.1 urea ABC transporter permease subunit UrtB [Glaciimonas sp. Gout2]
MNRLKKTLIIGWLCIQTMAAHAAVDPALLKSLAGDDPDVRIEAVNKIAALANEDAAKILNALNTDALYSRPNGDVLIIDDTKTDNPAFNPATDQSGATPDDAEGISVNNRLRGAVEGALSGLKLFSPDSKRRMAAAIDLLKDANPAQIPLINKALQKESDPDIQATLQQVIATANLHATDPALRKAAIKTLATSTNASIKPALQRLLDKNPDGSFIEPDESIRIETVRTLGALDRQLATTEFIGKVFYGISLGSVLLLAALGLAITFGLMGIINMAHGEMLMIGAYTTYVIQMLFRKFLPGALDGYLLVALPAAFIVTAAVGIALERLVLRWLYGRPLETLLCTWGISLMLMQTVRTIFGAQNVEVANPSWMSGGVTVLGSLVLSYNRIVIIFFALFVVFAVWLILNKTRLGLFVRAVMQNRRMAACVGVATDKIDMMTFGLGCGIAGLGGVALSQLGNVGPDLGQSYIVDSFMVVVLGGVGQLAGTVIAAIGLGEVNKFLEPVAGAVLAKIAILVFIIVFIQKRPQGLFALKGRSVE